MSSRSLKTFVVVCQTIMLALALAAAVMAQSPQPSLAPVNPAFVNYFQRRSMGLVPGTTDSGYPLRYVPPPVDLSQVQAPKELQHQLLSLPTSFDLRTQGKLTPIRNQGNCGSCWAFACYGSLESNLMPGESLNFSENHLKNTHGFDISCCDGGNSFMTSAYVARWSGPAYETDDPYNVLNCSSPSVTVRKHVQNVDFIPDRMNSTDNDLLKQAVMTYGAVYTSFYWSAAYYNSTHYAYYDNASGYGNHAVGIVGWDDNFDKSKFATAPPGNGAFIVRNSWGTSWGQSGYFYVSYYDSNFGKENALFRVTELTDNYDHIYQYDPLGWVNSLGYGSNTAWFANVFTASQNEMLSAVSFYAASVSSSYEIRVYLDPTSGPINPSGPVFSTSGTIADPGYQTIPIAELPVSGGHKFSVVIMLTTPGFTYPVPLETQWGGYSSGATANAGESYISASGGSWTDLTSSLANANCCIKAFTRDSMGMVITPTDNLASFGAVGGPFSPSSLTYTVTNTGSIPMDWTAGKTQPWVSLSSTGGSLPAGGNTTVTVSINSQAQSLDTGVYSDTVSFVNTTNGHGNTTRGVTLTVRDPCLEVSPAEGMTSYGETQGPFTPASTVYTLTNTGASTLNWIAAGNQPWLDVSPPSGSLGPSESANVTVSFNSAAEDLAIGDYFGTVTFTNQTNGAGDTSREIRLTVAHNYFIESATFAWADPGSSALSLGDDGVESYPIPFTFFFYGQPHTTLYIGANGLLGFNSALSAAENTALPTTAAPNDIVCPYWDDLDPAAAGAVLVNTIGQAPNRKLVITWQGVPHAGSANPLTFQALFCEGSNDIIFQYLEVQPADMDYGAGRSATIGLENASGTVARVYSVNGSTLLTNNLAVRFTMDPGDISELKKLPTNASICIHRAIISCACSSLFYIESDDRSCGIMVNKPAHGFSAGIRVDVKGTLSTGGTGEKYIKNPTIMPNGKGQVEPLTVVNRALGGADCDYDLTTGAGQKGIKDAIGLNNIGLLVRVTGRVTFIGDTFFYIDDGSNLNDGSGHIGLRVVSTEVTMPALNKYVMLLGASSCWKNGSDLQRQIRAIPQVIEQY